MGRRHRGGGRIGNGRIPRIDPTYFSCTTFNILAPIYKRLDQQNQSCRESECRDNWFDRNQRILDLLLFERSSIICLQEFWVGNDELVDLYDTRLGDAGYMTYKLARTNNRGDGLLTALHKDYFRVINNQPLLLHGFGDRVAQLLHVELTTSGQEMLIVNTHLLFPHDQSLCLERLRQVYKILQHVESFQTEEKLHPLPILLCGDWNGSKRGNVYKFLRSQGFLSSYDTAHQYTDTDTQKWVSHRNHRGNICGVDFIWLLNPNRYREVLKVSWSETVFGVFKCLLRRASLTEGDAFAILKADSDGDYITYSGFCDALRQLNLTGQHYGLTMDETRDLWDQADIDGNGILDYNEFQLRIWNPKWSDQRDEINDQIWDDVDGSEQTIGFNVKNAVLFPTEVEQGTWPEDYSLSDHALLTAVFSPVRMSCSRLILS